MYGMEMEFTKIFKELNKRKIKYLVAGGVAVNLHGFVRATADLDIMLLMNDENICRYTALIKELGYKPRVPVKVEEFADKLKRQEWIDEKGMKVFSVYNPKNMMEGMDVMIEEYINFEEAYGRRKIVKTTGVEVPLISIQDLVKLKELAGRGRDLIDIAALKEILREQENSK